MAHAITRVEAVVAEIRPEIEDHGGRLEVVKAEGGLVTIRLGAVFGDPSASTEKLRGLVEGFLHAESPDFVRMDLSSPEGKAQSPWEPTPVVIPLSRLTDAAVFQMPAARRDTAARVPVSPLRRVLVACVGNVLRGDDRFGLAVAGIWRPACRRVSTSWRLALAAWESSTS